MKKIIQQKGFTLMELLIVIAIIGILSAVVLASLGGSQARARDSKRLNDLRQVQTALETYWTDNGHYPVTGGWSGVCTSFGLKSRSGSDGYIPNLAPFYIKELPVEERPFEPDGCYVYRSDDGKDFMFLIYKTVEGSVPDSLKRPSVPNEKDFVIYTPGAANW